MKKEIAIPIITLAMLFSFIIGVFVADNIEEIQQEYEDVMDNSSEFDNTVPNCSQHPWHTCPYPLHLFAFVASFLFLIAAILKISQRFEEN